MRLGHSFRLVPLMLLGAALLISGHNRLSSVRECRAEGLLDAADMPCLESEQALEQELLALTNEHRMLQGLEALVPDEALAAIARNHSTGMAAQGFISHDLPAGDLKARITRAGYPHEVVRENVASAPTVYTAQNALIHSPGHERNILARDVTRVGIGIVRCKPPYEKELYITEIFASPREELRASVVHDMLLSRFSDLDRQKGSETVHPDPVLEKLASRSVHSLNIPYKKDDLQRLLADSANELQNEAGPQLTRVGMEVQLLRNPKNLKVPNLARGGQITTFGAAVRQIVDEWNQPALLVLTLIGYPRN